jgi:hypothetical protein
MARNSKMEIQKFNGKNFELWKLKMEDLLVERDRWIMVIEVLHLQEIQQMTRKIWIERQREQFDYVSQIQYY